MAVVATANAVERALTSMATMLKADGYELDVGVEGGNLELVVSATPDACAECLVPKEVFVSIAVSMLRDGDIAVSPSDLTIVYPIDQDH